MAGDARGGGNRARTLRIGCAVLALVLLALALSAGIAQAAAGPSCLSVAVRTPPHETSPGGMVTHVFVIGSHGAIAGETGAGDAAGGVGNGRAEATCHAEWTLTAPEGWGIVGPQRGAVTLRPGEEEEVFATVAAPPAAPAGEYRLSLEVRAAGAGGVDAGEGGESSGGGDSGPGGAAVAPATAEAVVNVARVGRLLLQTANENWRVLPGEEVRFSLILSNQGNLTEEILMAADRPSSWRVSIQPRRLELAPGERATIEVSAVVPPAQFPGTVHLSIEAASARSGATAGQTVRIGILPAEGSLDDPLHLQLPGIVRGYVGGDPKRAQAIAQGQVMTGGSLPSGLDVGAGLSVTDLSDPLDSSGFDLSARGQAWSVRAGSVGARLGRFVDVRATGVRVDYTPRLGSNPAAQVIVGVRDEEGISAVATELRRGRLRLRPAALATVPLTEEGESLRLAALGATFGLTSRLSADVEAAVSGRGDAFSLLRDPGAHALGGGLSLRSPFGSLRLEAARVDPGYEGTETQESTGVRLGDPGTEGAAVRAEIPVGPSTLRPSLQRFFAFGDPEEPDRFVNRIGLDTETAIGRRHKLTVGASLTDTQRTAEEPLGESMTGRFRVRLQGAHGPLRYGVGWSEADSFRQSSGWRPSRQEYDVGLSIGALWGRYIAGQEETSGRMEPFGRLELGIEAPIPYTSASLRVAAGQSTDPGQSAPTNRASVGIEAPLGTEMSIGLQLSVNAPGEAHADNPFMSWAKSILSPAAESWIGLTVARRFALPIPWVKVKGRIKGSIRLEGDAAAEGANSRRGLAGIYVRAGLHTVRTDAEGNFRFPPFEPGTYDVYLENLPADLTAAVEMPLRVTVEAGKEVELTIPIEKAVALTGRVFLDRDEDGAWSEGEPGVPGVRLLLYPGDAAVTVPIAEAFTSGQGVFRFTDLTPGSYRVVLDEEWLPERHVLLGAREARVDLAHPGTTPGAGAPSPGFPLKQVEKEVRFTYVEEE